MTAVEWASLTALVIGFGLGGFAGYFASVSRSK